jgi:hypothetical protein
LATDATHAYRGYRLQALYTLHQILHTQENNKLIFQPEGNEDLSVYDENLNLLEEIQIKAYSAPLPSLISSRVSRFPSLIEWYHK